MGSRLFFGHATDELVNLEQIRAVLEPVLRRLGYELWDVDSGRGPDGVILRITIDGIGGVTVDDCARVSRELGPTLDVEDLMGGRYSLEVSSPGLERILRTEEHFRRVIGSRVRLRLAPPKEGRRNLDGRVVAVEAGCVAIEEGDQLFHILLPSIQRAQVVFDWAENNPPRRSR